MKKFIWVLLIVSYVSSATTYNPGETTAEADGRGVGGGISHIREAFQLMSKEISSVVSAVQLQRNVQVDKTLDSVDVSKIARITHKHALQVVSDNLEFVRYGYSFATDGAWLKLSAEYWEEEFQKPNYELKMIAVLLESTQHEDVGALSAKILDLINVSRNSRQLQFDYRDSFGQF